MGKTILFLLVILYFCFEPGCVAQTETRIANPNIEFKDNKIHITFDILNSQRSDQYSVRLEISDSTGTILDAKALRGDIGENVKGGSNKEIIWNLEADEIFVDADLFIQIFASANPVSEAAVTRDRVADANYFNRTGLIMQSLAFPGLGLSRLSGKPHWLRGVAGYGCIAGSIALNRMAIATYEEYRIIGSAENASSLLAESTQQDNISEILAYAAIGIWITDFIWTMIGTSDLKSDHLAGDLKGISLGTDYDGLSNAPMIAIRYRF